MSQSVTTFMHMLIGVGGAGLAIYGSGKMCSYQAKAGPYKACVAFNKVAANRNKKRNCSDPGSEILPKILMYGGPGIIVVVFVVMAIMNSQMFGQGGGYQQQQYQQF